MLGIKHRSFRLLSSSTSTSWQDTQPFVSVDSFRAIAFLFLPWSSLVTPALSTLEDRPPVWSLFLKETVQRKSRCSGASTGTCGLLRRGLQDFPSAPRRASQKEKKKQESLRQRQYVLSAINDISINTRPFALIRKRAVCFQ